MYQQIRLDSQHQDLHEILWHYEQLDPLAEGVGHNFPLAAATLVIDTCIDDMVPGAKLLADELTLKKQQVEMLKTGRFNLRKYTCNSPEFLTGLQSGQLQRDIAHLFDAERHASLKVLGLQYDPGTDSFSYKVHPSKNCVIKRGILSDMATIFYPWRWLAPLVLWAKHMIQQLWIIGANWEADLPAHILANWIQLREELSLLEIIAIPRDPFLSTPGSVVEQYGFSDRSEIGLLQ
ncbi:hypothetical protein PR048_013836 [Dryococelus australis]|uniref:Uncharacterized protein n=1 Tax=Dryococelus australis TaxID=614101 RepID=A0ABQ9HU53_9NEOP|nr:hypothetical protein PR048_013836 [Dryococelus australis]